MKGFDIMDKQKTYEFLKEHHINYENYDHRPVCTVEEMGQVEIPYKNKVLKNLFLRDDKNRNYYLVSLAVHKQVDLKSLSAQIKSRRLSFCNEQQLGEILSLKPGSVTPLGILNNEQKNVIMVFDSDLKGETVGVHPMENTATVFLQFEALLSIIQGHGNPVIICPITPSLFSFQSR